MAEGGLGALSAIDLSKKLAGKVAFVRPDIDEMFEGLNGRALRRDLETMFQLIYLTFTQPRADPEAFRAMTGQLSAVLANRQAQPDAAFEDALNGAVTQNHLRARPMTPDLIAQMNLDKSLAFYKDRFADASDFTFVFVGSFDLADDQAAGRAVSGQPARAAIGRKPGATSAFVRRPAWWKRKSRRGPRRRARSAWSSAGRSRTTEKNRMIVRAMANTLAGNLQRVLREDLGGTYGVSVVPEFTKRPTEDYRVTITFACDPARTQDLVKALFAVVEDFKTSGPSAGTGRGRAGGAAAGSRNRQPAEWPRAESAAFAYQYGEPIPDPSTLRALYDQLTVPVLRDAARTYLDTTRYVKVVLLPEAK